MKVEKINFKNRNSSALAASHFVSHLSSSFRHDHRTVNIVKRSVGITDNEIASDVISSSFVVKVASGLGFFVDHIISTYIKYPHVY